MSLSCIVNPGTSAFVYRFQQTSGPVMAKGIEDTAMYRYTRMIALNEVGADPARFGRTVSEFHAANLHRQEHWPLSMLTTSTHDTKRSEDVRARLAVLSAIPDEWDEFGRDWRTRAARHRTLLTTGEAPSASMEYLVIQTLVGAWPLSEDRLLPYLDKATR